MSAIGVEDRGVIAAQWVSAGCLRGSQRCWGLQMEDQSLEHHLFRGVTNVPIQSLAIATYPPITIVAWAQQAVLGAEGSLDQLGVRPIGMAVEEHHLHVVDANALVIKYAFI